MSEEKSTNKKKVLTTSLAVGLAALMLVGGGTFAYLRSTTDEKVNEFQTNKVEATLTESENNYSIIPGTTQTKDPTVFVDNTVDAYVYVEVTDKTEGLVGYDIDSAWTPLEGVENVYYQEVVAGGTGTEGLAVLKGNTVTYDKTITNEDMQNKDKVTLSFKATAMQKEGFGGSPFKAYCFAGADKVVEVANNASVSDINTSITQAVDSAENSNVAVVISNDVTDTAPIEVPAGSSVTISLENGATLTNSTAKSAVIDNSGEVTIIGGAIDATAHQSAAIKNEVGATATLENVTLTRSSEAGASSTDNGGNSYYVILNQGTMTLTNCSVEADGKYSSLIENGWYDGSKNTTKTPATLTINSGTFSGGINTIKNDEYGELTINGGTFNNEAQFALMNYNVAIINGGTFTSYDSSAVFNCYYNAETSVGELFVRGGTFHYPSEYFGIYNSTQYGDNGTVSISDNAVFDTEYKTNYKG